MEKALVNLQRIRRLMNYFPGFDCGACGAPSCRSLAEDIAGKASISHCVFVQRVMEKNYKLSPDQAFVVIEKIWGRAGSINIMISMKTNLKLLAKELDLTCLAGEAFLERTIDGAYVSDLLSDVMGKANAGMIWITSQVHRNIVAVSSSRN